MRQGDISDSIARAVARFHHIAMPLNAIKSHDPSLFPTLRKWYRTSFDVKPQLYDGMDLPAEIAALERALRPIGHVRFCHNDLLSGNIILRKKSSAQSSPSKSPSKSKLHDAVSVAFIDYEYASYNYAEVRAYAPRVADTSSVEEG